MAIPFLATALLVAWIILIHRGIPAPPLVISAVTTRVTGPLTADGYIDFFKALEQYTCPPELATDDNGFRDFVRLFGDVGDYSNGVEEETREFYRLQKYEKLGLDPDVPPTLTLPVAPQKIFEDFYKAKEEEAPRLNLVDHPWTLEEYPMFADWIKEIDTPLDAIAEAIRKPIFFCPLLQSPESVQSGKPQNLIAILLSDVQSTREIARTFGARATYRIAQGNIDGAIDDQLTLLRLGRQMTYGGSLVQYLVGIAIEGMGRAIPVGANPEHPLSEQQICRILDGFDALPPRASSAISLEWERYTVLSVVQDIQISERSFIEALLECAGTSGGHSGLFDSIALPLGLLTNYRRTLNWNIIYRRVNEVYDAAQKPLPRTEYDAIMDEIQDAN